MKLKLALLIGIFALAVSGIALAQTTTTPGQDPSAQSDQGVKSDMKDAASSTKSATKKSARKTKRAAKRTTHKAASKTRQGAGKVEDKTQTPPPPPPQ